MRSSEVCAVLAALAATGAAARAEAQAKPEGFAASSALTTSAPGGGWIAMDALDMRGGLGGAIALTAAYAKDPVVARAGGQTVTVVSDEAHAEFGAAVTYQRWRFYLDMTTPIVVHGRSGTAGGYAFVAPGVDLGSNPDTLSDARLGFDARLLGEATSPFRLGLGAQVFVPSGNRADYDTDGTWRAALRLLFAGDDSGIFTYAGHVGLHVRPLDDHPTPGSPEGSELLFGLAAGRRFPLDDRSRVVAVVGPELYGASALRALFDSDATSVEALLGGRLEGTGDDGAQLRVKAGLGGGLNQHLGAPEWRLVVGVEVFNHRTDRDRDGVRDADDACPDVAGIHTKDPTTNGCPPDRDRDGVPDAEDACPDAPGARSTDPTASGCPPTPPAPPTGSR